MVDRRGWNMEGERVFGQLGWKWEEEAEREGAAGWS